ncbi:MAG: hypothetical protein EBS92_04000 [Proteobacteria bacterium]|nr:hypothetical protein [Pseudomonadota bacterium]
MFIILLIAVFAGVFLYRAGSYWKWIAYAYAVSICVTFLFAGGGTIENPVGDGLITYLVRKATNDGYQMALLGLLVIIIGYGGLIFCLRNAIKVTKDIKAKKISVEKISKTRGAIEFALLAIFLILNQVIATKDPINPENFFRPSNTNNEPTAESYNPSVEEQVRLAGIDTNKGLPQKIDDATTLEKITTDGRNMTYHYILSKNLDKEKIKNFILPNIIKGQCGNTDTRKLISENNLSYTYSYNLIDGSFFFDIRLDEELCKNHGY